MLFVRQNGRESVPRPVDSHVRIILYKVSCHAYSTLHHQLELMQRYSIIPIDDLDQWVDYETDHPNDHVYILITPIENIHVILILCSALPNIKRILFLDPRGGIHACSRCPQLSLCPVPLPISSLFREVDRWNESEMNRLSGRMFSRSLSGDTVTFICYQFFFKLLSQLHLTFNAREEMFNTVLKGSYNTIRARKESEEFVNSYSAETAIYWYGRKSLFYHAIHQRLRNHDLNEIFEYRAALVDIHNQLRYHCATEQTADSNGFDLVYREETFSESELEYYRRNVGSVVTIKPFLSATNTVPGGLGRDSTLMIIRLPKNRTGVAYARIDTLSY